MGYDTNRSWNLCQSEHRFIGVIAKQQNPLGELILRRGAEQGFGRKKIAVRLNYKNPNKGFLRLDQLLQHGYSNPNLLERLRCLLQLDPLELTTAVSQTEAILRAEALELQQKHQQKSKQAAEEEERRERASFKPHLWVVAERKVPSPIFVVAIFGEECFRHVSLPDNIESASEADQQKLIQRAAIKHFRQKGGSAGPFGRIIGYLFCRTFDQAWRLNIHGEVVDYNAGRVHRGKYSLQLKGNPKKDLAPMLKRYC